MSIFLVMFYVIYISFNFASCQLSEDIEIKSLTGEPNYKSVHLTWLVDNDENSTDSSYRNNGFFIHYCELQTWGSHRCKIRTLKDTAVNVDKEPKQYSTVIDNLKMATKYLFNVKSSRFGEQRATGRADFGGNELNSDLFGEKIIVPTKGFSAQATKCLPHASEVEIKTGPFFGGIIMTENNESCRIQGDNSSDQDRYVMRIDHEKCGSKVDHETLQVKTFITVQENLGIFTHSTRRFVVMCSYQPDTLTVRASFSVPSKSGLPSSNNDTTTDRESRNRSFRMVGKEALLLKKESEFKNLTDKDSNNILNGVGFKGDISEIRKQEGVNGKYDFQRINATFDRLVYDSESPTNESNVTVPEDITDGVRTYSDAKAVPPVNISLYRFLSFLNNHSISFLESGTSTVLIVLLTVSLMLVAAFVFVIGRKFYKGRLAKS